MIVNECFVNLRNLPTQVFSERESDRDGIEKLCHPDYYFTKISTSFQKACEAIACRTQNKNINIQCATDKQGHIRPYLSIYT